MNLVYVTQQGVPEFGVWNAPNVESYGFTNTFDVVRKVRRDRSSMDHIPIQQTIDRMPDLSKRPATSSGIGERAGNEKSRVGYDKGEIWEMESAGSAPNNFALQTGQSQRPPTKHQIERIRHELSPAKYQKVLASRDDPKVRQERPRTGTSSGKQHIFVSLLLFSFYVDLDIIITSSIDCTGSTNAVRNFPSEAGHRRRPSSSNDGSRRDILSSRQEEFMAKETTGPYHNPVSIRQIM